MNIFKKVNSKVGKIVLLYILAIMVVVFILVRENNSIYDENSRNANEQIETIKGNILDQMDVLDTLYLNQVKSSMKTLMRNGGQVGTPSLGVQTSFSGKNVPQLLFGEESMVGSYNLVDTLTQDMGGTATLFVWNGQEFVRVSTNVKKDDGSRAVGTVLTKGGAVEGRILSKQAFYGIVDILGNPYFTGYEPMYDASGDVIGIWYVGYPLEQMTALEKSIDGKKIFENDFYVITKPSGEIIAKSNSLSDEELTAQIAQAQSSSDWEVTVTVYEKWGYQVVSAVYKPDIDELAKSQSIGLLINIGIIFVLFSMFILYFVISTDRTNKKIQEATHKLTESAYSVAEASSNLSESSHSLSEGSTEQAAAIEQTSATMEETTSMVKQNAENTRHANSLSHEASAAAEKGSEKMLNMVTSMDEIKKSSNDISKIIKVIDDIAFQTNMLALNAAVEAARAGDSGLGFSVVAEEVRNLAQRSAEAAKNTESIIARNISLSEGGVTISNEVNEVLSEIMNKTREVNQLMNEISAASDEQARGTAQISDALGQMEKVVQSNAASAEESSAAAGELQIQAKALQEIVSGLDRLVTGAKSK